MIHRTLPRRVLRNRILGSATWRAASARNRATSEASSAGRVAVKTANSTRSTTSCERTHRIQRSLDSGSAKSLSYPRLCQNESKGLMSNPVVRRDPEATGAEPNSSFGDILNQFEQAHASPGMTRGDGREGTVIAVTGDSVFVDIGMKIEGIVPTSEFRDTSGAVAIQPGDKLRVAITGRNDEGYYRLSKLKVQRPKDWGGLEKAFQEKRAIAGVVSGLVKGGLNVDVGVRAFMPASRSGAKDAADMEKLVGQEITCKIIKLDVADEDVVVDRRVVLEVADISWGRINKPADVLAVGQTVEVQVLKVDAKRHRVSLGMKQLQPQP